ncbi:hypothetical protein [Endozoicomonas sp. 8E]|uniref:hypothetical protein n=1 Tax=Endozoicomonas sp. 8E TaxID=3035692 RepID=UPI00293911C3|nr:hypothetical protein [Endozoicomonas sp. 8E]WOG29987.1 hypothetical protein P6910_10125 [Endozoicomonas sp. 8E]
MLNQELVIGMNATTLLEANYNFLQSYYVVSDGRFISNPSKNSSCFDLLNPSTKRILRSDLSIHDDKFYQDKTFYVRPLERDGFSFDLAIGFYYGCTTTLLAIQTAVYLGCKDIYLLGLDLNYGLGGERFYKEESPQLEDSRVSVQIKNIFDAFVLLKDRGVNLWHCNKKSFISPYVPYINFCEVTKV